MSTIINNNETYKVEETPSMEESLNSSLGSFFNSDEQIGDKLVKIIISLMNTGIDLGMDMTLGTDITEKNIGEIKNELLNKLAIIKELAKDPLIQEKVSEAAKEMVNLGLETVEEVERPLNDIIDRLLEMIAETTNKTVKGSLETARGVAQSALAEIPVVGGLVDLALTAGVAFNRFGEFVFDTTDNVLESSERIGKVIESVSDNAQKAYKTYNDAKTNIENRVREVKEATQNIQRRVSEPMERIQKLKTQIEDSKETNQSTEKNREDNINTVQTPFDINGGKRKKKLDNLLTRITNRLNSV
jgi:gas vesicle protein